MNRLGLQSGKADPGSGMSRGQSVFQAGEIYFQAGLIYSIKMNSKNIQSPPRQYSAQPALFLVSLYPAGGVGARG